MLQDFRDMEQRQALYKAGRDKLGRQVVVFTLYNLGEKVDFERLLLYIIKVMDKVRLCAPPFDGRMTFAGPSFYYLFIFLTPCSCSWWRRSTPWCSARRT
jgi:hypothetical protein